MQLIIPQKNRSFGPVDAFALIGVVGLAIARWVPIATMIPFWGCGVRKLTGIPCPGCGLTRVADRFAHFHFIGALKANPLGTVAAAAFALAIVVSALHFIFKMPVPELFMTDREWKRARWFALGLFAVNYAWVIFSYTQLGWR